MSGVNEIHTLILRALDFVGLLGFVVLADLSPKCHMELSIYEVAD